MLKDFLRAKKSNILVIARAKNSIKHFFNMTKTYKDFLIRL